MLLHSRSASDHWVRQFAFSDGLRDRVRNGWRAYPGCGRFRGAAYRVQCRRWLRRRDWFGVGGRCRNTGSWSVCRRAGRWRYGCRWSRSGSGCFGNGQVQHIVLRIAPVGFGQSVSGVLFLSRYFPLVLADDLAVAVVVEAGNAVAVGGADEVAVQVVLVSGFLNLVIVAGEGMD